MNREVAWSGLIDQDDTAVKEDGRKDLTRCHWNPNAIKPLIVATIRAWRFFLGKKIPPFAVKNFDAGRLALVKNLFNPFSQWHFDFVNSLATVNRCQTIHRCDRGLNKFFLAGGCFQKNSRKSGKSSRRSSRKFGKSGESPKSPRECPEGEGSGFQEFSEKRRNSRNSWKSVEIAKFIEIGRNAKTSEFPKKVRNFVEKRVFKSCTLSDPSLQEGRPRNFDPFEPKFYVSLSPKLSIFTRLTVNQPLIRENFDVFRTPFFMNFREFLEFREFRVFHTFHMNFGNFRNFENFDIFGRFRDFGDRRTFELFSELLETFQNDARTFSQNVSKFRKPRKNFRPIDQTCKLFLSFSEKNLENAKISIERDCSANEKVKI